jgi:hypothetical protein
VLAMFDQATVTPPPADTQLWQFTGSHVTTYGGDHGSILGPWATSQWIDTTDGTHAGASCGVRPPARTSSAGTTRPAASRAGHDGKNFPTPQVSAVLNGRRRRRGSCSPRRSRHRVPSLSGLRGGVLAQVADQAEHVLGKQAADGAA